MVDGDVLLRLLDPVVARVLAEVRIIKIARRSKPNTMVLGKHEEFPSLYNCHLLNRERSAMISTARSSSQRRCNV